MANAFDCIDKVVEEGSVSPEFADEYRASLTEVMQDYDPARIGPELKKLIAQRVHDNFERRLARKKRSTLFQKKAQADIKARFEQAEQPAVDGKAPPGPGQTGLSFLQFDRRGEIHGPNLMGRYHQHRQENGAALLQFIDRFRSKRAGVKVRNKEQTAVLDDVVRELHGEKTGNTEAQGFAEAYTARREELRRQLNIAGGDVRTRQDWSLPQHHSREGIRRRMEALGRKDKAFKPEQWKERWVDFMLPRVHMFDAAGERVGVRTLRQGLSTIYDDVMTGGLSQVGERTGASPVNKRIASRNIHFNSAEDWLDYNKEFGVKDAYGVMMDDLDALAKDLATLQVLGPYPDASIQYIKDQVRAKMDATKQSGGRVKHVSNVTRDDPAVIQRMWDTFSGRLDEPVSESLANFGATVRAAHTGALLGSSPISAIVDVGNLVVNSRFNNLPAMRVLWEMLGQLNPKNKADRRTAAQLGFIADTWLDSAHAAYRFSGQTLSLAKGGKLRTGVDKATEVVLRASGLTAWTDSGRTAFRLGFLAELTNHAQDGIAYDGLPDALLRTLKRYNITEEDWLRYMGTTPWTDARTGAKFIRTTDVYEASLGKKKIGGEELRARYDTATKLFDMIDAETYRAIITPDLRARSALNVFGTNPGTVGGEAVRSFAQFKSFAVSLVGIQGSRISGEWARQGGRGSALRYATGTAALMMVMAFAAVQLREIVKGREPYSFEYMTDFSAEDGELGTGYRFWAQVATQAGFLGLVGDFLSQARYGFGVTDLLGPVGSTGEKAIDLFGGTASDLIEDEETDEFGKRLVELSKQFTPGQSLWWARKFFFERMYDTIEELIDGDAAIERWDKARDRLQEEERDRWFGRGTLGQHS